MTITQTRTDVLESVIAADDHRSALYSLSTDDLVAIALRYVETVAARRARANVRQIETASRSVPLVAQIRADAKSAAKTAARDAYKATMLRKFAPLLDQRIDLGGGVSTTWGHATPEQHADRIAMLTKQANGIGQTIALHQEAIDGLHELGIVSLEWLAK
ncbi:hypothetical protein [Curtobacterium sp. USHLN213]|uniref:hypothetical protein n=1 Tax=Curtobacterium sp. USHLN213 TaxID=3081255 RepID=UPI00301AC0FF